MDFLGIEINAETNTQKLDGLLDLSSENSNVKTLVIATNEELEIAWQVYSLLN